MTKTWSAMSNAEKVALGTTLAGVNQYKVFSAVMNNFDQAINATNESFESSGATLRQNAVYMESLEAKVQELKTEFEKFVLGDGGLQDFAKITVSMTTSILSLVNTLGGLKSVLTVIVGILATVKIEAIYSSIIKVTSGAGSLITTIANIGSALISSKGNVQAFDIALKGLGISASVAEIAMGALTVAISGIVIAYNTMQQAKEESLRASKDTITSNEQELESLESLINQVENEKITREQLFDVIKNSTISGYEEEISKMEDVNEMRQAVIDKIYEEAKAKAENTVRETGSEYSKQKDFLGGSYTIDRLGNFETPKKALEELEKRIDSFNVKLQNGEKLTTSEQNALNALTAEYTNLKTKVEDAETVVNGYEDASELLNQTEEEWLDKATEKQDALDGINEIDKEFIDTIKEVNKLTEEQSQQLDEAIAKWIEEGNAIDDFDFDGFISGLDDATNSTNNAVDATERLKQANEELTNSLSQLSSMSSAYDTLSNAVAEYNANGSLSLQTLSDLNALGSEYISLLEVENGVMSISEQGLLNLANAYIDDAEAKAYDKATAELAKVAQEGLNSAQIAGQSAGSSAANGATTAGNAIAESGKKADIARQQWENAWKAIANSGGSSKSSNASANSIKSSLETTINSLEKLRTSLGKNVTATVKNMGATTKNTKATGGGTSAKKANTSANKANTSATNANTNANNSNTSSVDENTEALKKNVEALKEKKEALEKEVDEYKTVISYITSKVDEEIDKLEEQRDAEIQVIKDKIEANKELADKEDKIIDEKIERLKEQRDIEEDYYNNKIAKLKEQNEAIEEQMELEKLLQNLQNAKNKKVKVYKKGQGFVYGTDEDEVNKAQQELDEYYRKKALEEQVKELEDARDSKLAIYDSEIKSLEQYQKDVKEYYEKINENLEQQITEITNKYASQIKPLKEWKEEFTKAVNAYQDEVNRQLAIQKTGIDFESQGWQTRMHNLSEFVKTYNNKLKELGDLEKQLQDAEEAYRKAQQATQTQTVATTTPTTSTTTTTPTSTTTTTSPTTSTANKTPTYNYKVGNYVKKYSTKAAAENYMSSLTAQQRGQYTIAYDRYSPQNYYVVKLSTIKAYNGITSGTASSYASQLATSSKSSTVYWRYATGTPSVESNQIALVGDDPKNRELVIGSKLNGTAMNLQKGSGVVNAESTNTLAGLLNCLGKFSGSNFGNGNGVLNSNTTNSQDLYIDKVVIEGSNITDIVSFKNSLMNLKSEATQRAYKHT